MTTDLIDRLEKAAGPDRELDRAIAAAIIQWPTGIDGDAVMGMQDAEHLTPYTSSIDAALTLVPEGHDWVVGDVNGQVGGTPYACVGSTKKHFGETAVLSLCIAALRARTA